MFGSQRIEIRLLGTTILAQGVLGIFGTIVILVGLFATYVIGLVWLS
jgi:hypothetical protein